MIRPVTDTHCLRHHHELLGRILDFEPWTQQQASEAQRQLLGQAFALREKAASLDPQSAYGPAIRIKNDAARNAHHLSEAMAAAEIRRHRDDLIRDARNIEMRAGSIPQDRHDASFVAWMIDHIAAVEAYAHLCEHPGDYDGMKAVAQAIRQTTGVTVDGVRVLARDTLDRTCREAGVPQWRKTYFYEGAL